MPKPKTSAPKTSAPAARRLRAEACETPLDQPEVPLMAEPVDLAAPIPTFTIDAGDALAPDLVDGYADALQAETGDTVVVRRARAVALRMRAWQAENPAALPGAAGAGG